MADVSGAGWGMGLITSRFCLLLFSFLETGSRIVSAVGSSGEVTGMRKDPMV